MAAGPARLALLQLADEAGGAVDLQQPYTPAGKPSSSSEQPASTAPTGARRPRPGLMAGAPLAFRPRVLLFGLAFFALVPYPRPVHVLAVPVRDLFRPFVVYRRPDTRLGVCHGRGRAGRRSMGACRSPPSSAPPPSSPPPPSCA
ncbi:respiratory nitrate reductase subunit gamma [Streptomyces sp. CC208A]|uniref:respiratory nitrate reductase subunit gamma n=1 Tax=Streptomyces sp. CC208A TaxID=3044573 RepID=UPI0024A80932|nr:respiratory nitrate reductase subunit gamma [Streptomyces sp. CC208A]